MVLTQGGFKKYGAGKEDLTTPNDTDTDDDESEKYQRVDDFSDWKWQVDELISEGLPERTFVTLPHTPAVMQMLKVTDLPIKLSSHIIAKVTGGKHDIELADIRNLPELLADPLMIFDSLTKDNALVVLTEITDKAGKPVVVAIHLAREGKFFIANEIASIYGKDDFVQSVNNWLRQNKLRYINHKKSSVLPVYKRLYLPSGSSMTTGSQRNSTTNIPDETDLVKFMRGNSLYHMANKERLRTRFEK